MKSCNQWSDEMNGETSPQIVNEIQQDALIYAAEIASNALYEAGRKPEALIAMRAILDSLNTL